MELGTLPNRTLPFSTLCILKSSCRYFYSFMLCISSLQLGIYTTGLKEEFEKYTKKKARHTPFMGCLPSSLLPDLWDALKESYLAYDTD